MRKVIVLLLLLLVFAVGAVDAQTLDAWRGRAVISVIDGDTLVLDNGEVVRLIGLLAPRAKHGKQEGEPFGEQARTLTEEMLLGQRVDISFDPAYGPNAHRDKDGRAVVYITFKRGVESFIANMELLKQGAAFLAPLPENLEFADVLKTSEADARRRKVGIWATNEKSPQEIATAAGKTFEERGASISLIYIRPTRPITEGPGVGRNQVAVSTTPTNPNPKSASLRGDDLRPTAPPPPKPKVNDTPQIDPATRITNKSVFFTGYDSDTKLELLKAVREDGDADFRIVVQKGDKDVTMITNKTGLKNLQVLLNKGTDSQPSLTSIEASLGTISGERGSVLVTTGRDGGLVLNVNGRDGALKFYLNRQSALKMQLAISNQ